MNHEENQSGKIRILCMVPNLDAHVCKFFLEMQRQDVEIAALLEFDGNLLFFERGKWVARKIPCITDLHPLGLRGRLLDFYVRKRGTEGFQEEMILLKSAIAYFKPQLIHIHWLWSKPWLVFLSGFPYIMTCWGSDINLVPSEESVVRRWQTRLAMIFAKTVTGPTPFMMRQIRNFTGPFIRMREIPFPGVDIGRFSNPRPELLKTYRNRFPKSSEEILVFSPRALQDFYNIPWILRSFARFRKEMPAKLLLLDYRAQHENYINQIEEQIADLSIISDVYIFRDMPVPFEEMNALYAISDIVVSVPEFDAMASSVLEGMLMRKAVILTDLPTYEGVFENGRDVITVKKEAENTLFEALTLLARSQELRSSLAECAYKKAMALGDISQNSARFIELYREVMSE